MLPPRGPEPSAVFFEMGILDLGLEVELFQFSHASTNKIEKSQSCMQDEAGSPDSTIQALDVEKPEPVERRPLEGEVGGW